MNLLKQFQLSKLDALPVIMEWTSASESEIYDMC